LSTLSEKATSITGLLLNPYKVWVELNALPLTVWLIISKLEEVGGGVGGVGEDEGFEHCTSETMEIKITRYHLLKTFARFLTSLMIHLLQSFNQKTL